MISCRRRENNYSAKETSIIQRDKLFSNAVVLQRKISKRNIGAPFLQHLLGLAEAHAFAHGKLSSKLHFAAEKAFQDI